MSFIVTLDWKFVLALGGSVTGIIFAAKMGEAAVERVSTHAVDAYKEYAIAVDSIR